MILKHSFWIRNGIVSSQIYDKHNYFNFETVNFPFLDGDFFAPFPMVYIFHSIFILLECVPNVDYFNIRNLFLTAKF